MPGLFAPRLLAVVAGAVLAAAARGQAPVPLAESFAPGVRTAVELKVELNGRMVLPPEKDKEPRVIRVVGTSLLKYDERTLPADDDAEKVLRVYRDVSFKRTVGGRDQSADLRPAVRRTVVLRSARGKSPFSPDGPMTWNELDLVRTDVFAPALVPGLLPGKPVRPGDEWPVSAAGVREITDLEKVDGGTLTVKYVGVVPVNGKDHARLSIAGTVRGVDDLGPGKHVIDGTAYFDLTANVLDYLSLTATHDLLDGMDNLVGRIEGRFVLTRTRTDALPDDAVKGLELKPTADNSLLLYDNPDLGVRFAYPRGWRVGAVQGKQLTLDGPNRSGVLVTVEPPAKVPTGAAYRGESEDFLRKEKATIGPSTSISRLAGADQFVERFGLDAEVNGESVRMEYAVLTQADGGVIVAARLPRADAAARTADLERVLKKMTVTKRIVTK